MRSDEITITPKLIEDNMSYLQLLAHIFPSVASASTEIINLEAILNLPKGTEHFLADIHGEYEAFQHVLKNASGNIKRKVKDIYANNLRESEIRNLCTLIYYPEEKLELVKASEPDIENWYTITIHQLVEVCRSVSSKYTRSKVRKALPKDFAYIIEELLHESADDHNKQAYVNVITKTIISTERADDFIVDMCNLIQQLAIDQLHLLGDIYDRGPGAHIVMDTLLHYHSFDIQWGNHDILWMGAAAGNECCICNVLRISLRYANMETLQDGYGINLLPLATLAMDVYGDDSCEEFMPRLDEANTSFSQKEIIQLSKMHKAIAIMQFKLEGAMVDRHPEWKMNDRKLLHHIDFEKKTIRLNGKDYPMDDCHFPTIDPKQPYALTAEESEVISNLHHQFVIHDRLRKHIGCLLSHGCIYNIHNSNLLFHASVPLNADGTLKKVLVGKQEYAGKELFTQIGLTIRKAFNSDTEKEERDYAVDYFWYLWCGPNSPLFDKSKMSTFERYFIKDKETWKEENGYYYKLRDNEQVCDYILDSFGVEGKARHIINGHVPVHASSGEQPVKANGKLLVIDGGFSKAYHDTTGIAGYTLVYHSRGFELVQHEPFSSAEESIRTGADIKSSTQIVELSRHRMLVRDTDKGAELCQQIVELRQLLYAYRHGIIKEKGK
jgi:fructose-1,6-bisphosphatase-3